MALGRIDLSADLAEGDSTDFELLERISSASVCCGAHAGDPATIRRVLARAGRLGVVVGAHPGYPDRSHRGRRPLPLEPPEIRDLILTQVEDLALLAADEGVMPRYLKPHGALYHQAQVDPAIAFALVNAAQILHLGVYGMAGSALEREARDKGVRLIREGFPERGYASDGTLLPRDQPGAVLDEPEAVAAQGLRLAASGVETLCLHADHPRVLDLAAILRERLQAAGYTIAPVITPGS